MSGKTQLVAVIGILAFPGRLLAADSAEIDAFWDALRMTETLEIMRLEGLDYAADLADQMLPSGATPTWTARAEEIYELDEMIAEVRVGLEASVGDADLSPVIAYFSSDLGQRIVGLELSARRAQLDEDVEEAAVERYMEMSADNHPRVGMIERFIEAGDLIEANVVGSLNSNYMFYMGLIDGNPDVMNITEDQALSEVWSQEGEIRVDTEEWLYSFLLMAYQPLSDAELNDYIAFSDSPDGDILTRALFGGFDPMFSDISYTLGNEVARAMESQEL